jgi:bacteriorhodopsin
MPEISSSAVLYTTYASIIVQLICGLVSLQGLTVSLPPEKDVLKKALTIETIVECVEFSFYVWFVVNFNLSDMAATRYLDWFITTPTMLFTTVLLMKYESLSETQQDTKLTVFSFIKENKSDLIVIFLANLSMLITGYLGEIGIIDKYVATIVGFMCFSVSFAVIYRTYARHSRRGKQLYAFLIIVWGLYGIAYLLPESEKNIGFNILDVVAKNFFALYLLYKINAVNTTLTTQENDQTAPQT